MACEDIDDDWMDGYEVIPPPPNASFNSWNNTGSSPRVWRGLKGNTMDTIRHTSVTETDFDTQSMISFFKDHPVDTLVRFEKSYNLKDGPDRILDWLLERVFRADRKIFQVYERNRRIQGFTGEHPIHIEVSSQDKDIDVTSTVVEMFGRRDVLKKIRQMMDQAFDAESAVPLQWWYKGQHGVTNRKVFLPSLNTRIVSELYPDITPGPQQYIKNYLDSDASILLMAGPPGTGKTTLLRHMIKDHNLGAHVIYDETLMSNDNIFQNFLFESSGDLMIIEDADAILSSREHDQNKLMARFLNVSDGLIKLPNKKLVFTTNVTDFGKVDPAIIRPGRCYDVLHTRPLNLTEAQAAARVCNLPVPTKHKDYSLAELFNQGTRQYASRSIGFASV